MYTLCSDDVRFKLYMATGNFYNTIKSGHGSSITWQVKVSVSCVASVYLIVKVRCSLAVGVLVQPWLLIIFK